MLLTTKCLLPCYRYKCVCKITPLLFITDIDECANGSYICHDEANCVNLVGSYECACKHGYIGDGKSCLGMSIEVICGRMLAT